MHTFVAHVIDPRDPDRRGRILVRFEPDRETPQDTWVPVLRGVSVRIGDAVLLATTVNAEEPILVGILDGWSAGTRLRATPTTELELRDGEVLEVRDSQGRALLLLHEGTDRRVLQLIRPDLDLEVLGALRIRSDELAIAALRSATMPDAEPVVFIRGEVIHVD